MAVTSKSHARIPITTQRWPTYLVTCNQLLLLLFLLFFPVCLFCYLSLCLSVLHLTSTKNPSHHKILIPPTTTDPKNERPKKKQGANKIVFPRFQVIFPGIDFVSVMIRPAHPHSAEPHTYTRCACNQAHQYK